MHELTAFFQPESFFMNSQMGRMQEQGLPEGQCHGLYMSRQYRGGLVEVSKLIDKW